MFPVNCFVIISGFFGIRSKIEKIIELWLRLAIVCIAITLGFFCFGIYNGNPLKSLFPLRNDVWWFMTSYFMLYLLSPLLNYIDDIEIEKPKLLFIFLIILDFIFHNSFANFIICYIIGKLLKRISFSKIEILSGVLFGFIFHLITIILLSKYNSLKVFLLISNYSPTVIVQAILIFLLFQKFEFSNNFINSLGSVSLYVYLITDHPMIRNKIVEYINVDAKNFNFIKILLFSIIIFIISIFLGYIFKIIIRIVNLLVKKIFDINKKS